MAGRPGASGCGGSGSRAACAHDPPPEVQQTLLPVPRTAGSPSLPGSQLLTSLAAAATCTEGPGSWGVGLGQSAHTSPPFFCAAPWLCSWLGGGLWVFGFSLWDSLSLSVSLSLLPSAAIWPALLPSQPHSRAFSQEAEPEGPPRSGCRDISRGGGLAARGPGKALAAQRGGGGPGGFLSCAADSRGIGTSPRIPASAASYHWQ